MFDTFNFPTKPASVPVTRKNCTTGETKTINLPFPQEDQDKWAKGWPLQSVTPYLTDNQRDWLINCHCDSEVIAGAEYVPYWLPEAIHKDTGLARTNPRFLARTSTVYAKTPIVGLKDRSATSHFFSSLLEYLPKGAIIAGGFMSQLVEDMLLAKEPSVEIQTDTYGNVKEIPSNIPKTHLQQKDIDIFFTSERAFRETLDLCLNPPSDSEAWAWNYFEVDQGELEKLNRTSDSMRFINFKSTEKKPSLQLIKLAWYEGPEHVIDTFDFTCVQFATDGEFLYFNPLSTFDLARKRLVLHRMQFPASTLRRLIKYGNRGFYACPGSLVKISEEMLKAKLEGTEDDENFVYLD